MAALRKKDRSPFWFACFTMPDGKRTQRSTKETARKAAQSKADEWEHLTKTRANARQSQRVIADIYAAAHKKELPDSTTRLFFNGWLNRRQGELAPASLTAYKGRATHFIEWLGDSADRPIAEIETRHITAYRDALAARLSPNTANQGVKLLRVIYEDARRENHIAENPAKDCGSLKKDTSTTDRRPFTMDELRSVLAVADDEWRSMIFCGLYTGQRLADIARFTWANVDLSAGEIQLRTAKTRRMVRIPICSPLMTHLESLPSSDDPRAPLHPRAAALAAVNSSSLSRQFGELVASVGLNDSKPCAADGEKRTGHSTRRTLSSLSFHSLRHTATSLMKNAGVSPAVVQDIIGHDSAEMSAHYTHIESDAKRLALEALPDLHQQTKSKGLKALKK
jgi:integrase